jgi:hypothetical protein
MIGCVNALGGMKDGTSSPELRLKKKKKEKKTANLTAKEGSV